MHTCSLINRATISARSNNEKAQNHIELLATQVKPHTSIRVITNDNQKLGSAFDDLDSRLSLLCKLVMMSSAPAKSAGDARNAYQDPFIHGNQCCAIQSRLQSVLGVRSFYVERNNNRIILLLLSCLINEVLILRNVSLGINVCS